MEIAVGRTPPRKDPAYWTDDLERPFCSIADMTEMQIRPEREGVTALAEAEGKAKRVPANSLLLSFKLSIGRVGFAATDLFPNEAIAWLDPKQGVEVDRWFLALYLESFDYSGLVGRAVKGQTLNKKSLARIPVTLPPLEEQRRIARLMREVDRTISANRAAGAAAQRLTLALREEVLAEMSQDMPLGRLLESIDAGRSPAAAEHPPGPGRWGVLKVTAVRSCRYHPAEVKELPADYDVDLRFAVHKGDVLITRAGGNMKYVGVACRVDVDPGQAMLSDKTLRLRLDTAKVDPDYVVEALASRSLRGQIERLASGGAGQLNISQAQIRTLRIPLPQDPTEQKEALALIHGARTAAEAHERVGSSLIALRAGLLAFLLSGRSVIPPGYDRLVERLEGATVDLDLVA